MVSATRRFEAVDLKPLMNADSKGRRPERE
jgi:hypothetical protein